MANSGYNKAILMGHLGQDPELRYLNDGKAYLKLRLATSEGWKDKAGNKQERTEWHSLVLWGPRAEGLSKILSKGDRIHVEGAIRYRTFEKQDGSKGYSTEIEVAEVVLCGSGRKEERREQEYAGAFDHAPGFEQSDEDDGVPF